MNPLEKAFDSYVRAMKAIDDNQAAHPEAFNTHKQLALKAMDAEGDLRDAVAIAGTGISNRFYTVKYTPVTQTYADIEVIDQLIKEGKIAPGLRDLIVKTTDRPPRINILPAPKDDDAE